MKITLCGSLKFYDKMIKIKEELLNLGHSVTMPIKDAETDYNNKSVEQGFKNIIKHDTIREHYNKILNSDSILVVNYKKNGIENYIGGNSFLEMGFAYVNNKKIFVLNQIPNKGINYLEEILGMQPTVLHQDLTKISENVL